MAKYRVSGYLTITAVKELEANSPEEALRKAAGLSCPSLCHQCECARGGDEEWDLGGFDDPPEDAAQHVEEIAEDG